MKKSRIVRFTKENIGKFINTIYYYDFDIDISRTGKNQQGVDAKSLVGVLSLGLENDLVVHYEADSPEFEALLDLYEVKPGEEKEAPEEKLADEEA